MRMGGGNTIGSYLGVIPHFQVSIGFRWCPIRKDADIGVIVCHHDLYNFSPVSQDARDPNAHDHVQCLVLYTSINPYIYSPHLVIFVRIKDLSAEEPESRVQPPDELPIQASFVPVKFTQISSRDFVANH